MSMRSVGVVALCLGLALSACGEDEAGDDAADSGAGGAPVGGAPVGGAPVGGTPVGGGPGPALPDGCDALLAPSDDDQTALQTALIEAEVGSTLCLAEGTFRLVSEASLTVDGVRVKGAGRELTILDFSAQDVGANGVIVRGNGVTFEALTVKNTPGDGIRADDVDGITFLNVAVLWDAQGSTENGAYGLYPVNSANVLIDGCLVQGARDAGIYVGQSSRIVVRNSEASGNVAGIEIENSTDAEVHDNYAHDNSGGILVFNLPELPVQDGARAKVHRNRVENNNAPNFGAAGTTVANVPPGTGILVVASDNNEFHDNTVTGNVSGAMMIISYIDALLGEYEDPDFDKFPVGNWVHDNTFDNNGTDPQGALGALGLPVPLPDLMWDGCLENPADAMDAARRNCFSNNTGADYIDFKWCENLMGPVTDLETVNCTHTPLPGQDL
jgi:parallel beta-helix repeat protein